jgi:LysM repeat protein
VNADKIRVWIARFAAPLAFFFAATVLVILVQRALESDAGEAGTNGTSTEAVDTGPTTTTPGGDTEAPPRGCRKQRYTVRSGDTLESIAAKCEVPLADLIELNPNIDPLTLNPGDRIRIRSQEAQAELNQALGEQT